MSELACASCKALHDFEMAPDEGVCLLCGGNLIEDESERELVGVGAVQRGLEELAADLNDHAAVAGLPGRVKVEKVKRDRN